MRPLSILLLAVLIASCDIDNFLIDNLLVDTRTKSLPAEVQLHLGQSALFPHEGYTVTFEKVTEDSRCPTGLMCFWAGDGAAKLTVKDSSGSISDDTLHTTLGPQSAHFQRLIIRLKALAPYPVYNVPTDTSAYVVTLEIDRVRTDSVQTGQTVGNL